jgi:DNA-binding GntR family transcriptional regulator
MGFDVSTAVEPLDFDFGQYGPKGTIPEPSTERLDRFKREMRELMEEVSGKPAESEQDTERRLAALTPEDWQKLDTRMYAIVARLCGNSLTAAQLRKLPPRVSQAFVGWLMGQLAPNRSMPGTTT